MDSSSPISVQKSLKCQESAPESSPKQQPFRKSFVTSLMEAATLRTPSFKGTLTSFPTLSHLKKAFARHFGGRLGILKNLKGVVAYMHGFDREGHPVCYNAYGVFKDKEMYERIFGDEEKLKNAEFVPNAEGSYTIAVEKPRKIAASEEAIHNSFTSREAGKMVLSVDNSLIEKFNYRYMQVANLQQVQAK
ncbi:hypothetical protein HAX54_027569 [Datura stramonium]|uniref:Patellin-1-6 C-terminal GOLD domain-containing protein n=1 Tax=Datura stramonium TaxID=4076 RepID=A0ABS8S8U7_DATST|nr:hypothetical protein [Datura stramonium]